MAKWGMAKVKLHYTLGSPSKQTAFCIVKSLFESCGDSAQVLNDKERTAVRLVYKQIPFSAPFFIQTENIRLIHEMIGKWILRAKEMAPPQGGDISCLFLSYIFSFKGYSCPNVINSI